MERRLAAILVADIVGYSAHVGRDETGAIAAYKGHFGAIEPIVGLHGGRVVKTMGDGFLAEFGSVVDAVSAAAAMQERMAQRNRDQSAEARLEFRMGLHVGDVLVDGEDILGDGVNIAARLQALAEPGGVVVSARVHDDVIDRLDLGFVELGAQTLKNIARPVSAFALTLDAPKAQPSALAPPDKPSVAVLPFDNMSADAEQEYFADGITEDIITSLSYVPWLFVIARNSSFTYRGLAVDVREVGRQLGVRYVLEGSVRRAGSRLRVTGQLIDAETGNHIWAGRYDGALEDVFDLQDRITAEVVGAIAPEIRSAEIARANRKRPENLDAYDHYLQALAAVAKAQVEDAARHLEAATERAPSYAKAKAMRAWCATVVPWVGRPLDTDLVSMAGVMAEEVLDRLDSDPEDEAYAGYTLAFSGRDPARGLALLDRTIERCPSFAWAWTSSAMLHAFRGNAELAIERGLHALRLSPRDPMAFRTHMALCFAYVGAGKYERIRHHARLGLELNPRAIVLIRMQIVALSMEDRLEEAADLVRQHMEAAPKFRVSDHYAAFRVEIFEERIRRRIIDGLRKAGLPE